MSKNYVELEGIVTRNPEMNYKGGLAVLKFTLAIERSRGNGIDYIRHVAFGDVAEKMNKDLGEGVEICVTGRIQTGSYLNRENVRVYTTDVVVASYRVNDGVSPDVAKNSADIGDGFMHIPDDIDEELPFN